MPTDLLPGMDRLPFRRARPRVLAHMVDGGCEAVRFVCRRCGRDAWVRGANNEQARRGYPCPRCNGGDHAD